MIKQGQRITAIIFDCFGVLTADGWLSLKQQYFGHDLALLQQVTDLHRQVNSGLYDHDTFIGDIARLANVSEATVRQRLARTAPNEELLHYIATVLKPQYKIGMLSNAGNNWLGEILRPEQLALFDAIALSYELGVTKPEPQAYEAIADLLQVEPKECVMVDDQERHCIGAREAGMYAILYQNFKQFKQGVVKDFIATA